MWLIDIPAAVPAPVGAVQDLRGGRQPVPGGGRVGPVRAGDGAGAVVEGEAPTGGPGVPVQDAADVIRWAVEVWFPGRALRLWDELAAAVAFEGEVRSGVEAGTRSARDLYHAGHHADEAARRVREHEDLTAEFSTWLTRRHVRLMNELIRRHDWF